MKHYAKNCLQSRTILVVIRTQDYFEHGEINGVLMAAAGDGNYLGEVNLTFEAQRVHKTANMDSFRNIT
ncbi:hypothetical protein ACTAF0_08965 [Streptomyces murinus]|uniref:hypothetical protein n=1 Tax=Streptomyces murinus TaxID=33900 RepID=UPI003F481AB2